MEEENLNVDNYIYTSINNDKILTVALALAVR